MKKNLLLTCLLTLVAALGMAQVVKATFPITLTEAEGLPGPFVVQNYLFKSETYQVDAPVQKIRLTVCNTNTANNVGRGSHDGISAYDGPGQPFFTMSEVRFFDENGAQVDYVANANSVDPGDGGGLAALSDNNEGTYLHTNYGGRCWSMPYEYHYVEFELAKEVSTFYFTIQTRSKYYKNLITYMGVTAGSIDATEEELAYAPYPEQEFKLGEKVASIEEFAQDGALFVMQGSAQDYVREFSFNASNTDYVRIDTIPGDLFMRSPYEGAITPTAANVFYLIPDADGTPDTYRVCWVNSGRYIAKHTDGLDIWTTWTRDISEAAALTITKCDTADGYYFTLPAKANVDGELHEFTAYLGYDCQGRMDYIADSDSAFFKTSRPHSYNWTVYNASINGAAISAQLQTEIDEAEERIKMGLVEGYDDGEYDALKSGIDAAKLFVNNPAVAAADILTMARSLRTLTTAYAIVSLYAYADSIGVIEEMAGANEIKIVEGPDWQAGAYLQSGYDALLEYMDEVDAAAESAETLADVDKAIENLYKAIDTFWGSKLPEDIKITELPFRLGRPEDGLPGTLANSVFSWKSPTYYFEEEIDAIRMTVFATKSGRNLTGKPFVCLTELEFFDEAGVKIPMTGDCFYSTSEVNSATTSGNDRGGLAALCDGDASLTGGKYFHSQWSSDADYDGSEYFFLDITFPEPVTGFSFAQHGRGNGYDDVPTDFVIGFAEEIVGVDDVAYPVVEDPYGAVLGEPITDASEITDDGYYAIVGNWNGTPDIDPKNYAGPIFYSGLNCHGPVSAGVAGACAYRITKTDNDSTFNIFSLASNKYLMNNGEGGNYYTSETDDFEKAAKVRIVPSTPLREELGAAEFENAFFIYQYKDTITKVVTTQIDDTTSVTDTVPHPYLMLDSWGSNPGGRFVWRAMYGFDEYAKVDNNGLMPYFQGELEWHIYKMDLDKPSLVQLQGAYEQAAANEMFVGTNPGYYTDGSVGAFANALAKARAALESFDEAQAADALAEINATKHLPDSAKRVPITPGTYVIESAEPQFAIQQGSPKVLCSYFNRFTEWANEGLSTSSEYSLWWTYAPEDYFNCHVRYQFELIPAVITEDAPEGSIYSEQLAIWFEDSAVTEEHLKTAYFIKSVETGQYVSVAETLDELGLPRTSRDIGFSDEPLYPYVFLEQGAYKFNIWTPFRANQCFHLLDHGGGGGSANSVCHWNGDGVTASQFKLYKIADPDITGINGVVDAEGEVIATSYYTADGAAVAAPVKGINIVKKTYANGVVKTTKEFVK